MKRLAAAAAVFLLLFIPGQHARADGAALAWDSDRVINSIVVIDENDTLTVEQGVNLGFEPGNSGQPAENDTRPILAVMGRLLVNGTRDEPVSFWANESLWLNGGEPDCVYLFSDGRADRFSVRNASFSNMMINIDGSGGVFRDCVFERCDVLVGYSAASFFNCSFIFSIIGMTELPGGDGWPSAVTVQNCRFLGRDPASHPPLPYRSIGYEPDDVYMRTAMTLQNGAAIEGCTVSGYNTAILLDMNSSSIRNCEIRDCGNGIILDGSFQTDNAEVRHVSVLNCSGTGISAWGRLTLADSVIGDCDYAGVAGYGDLLMGNCTVYGCPAGVELRAWFDDPMPDWLLTGNRFFGCTGYALVALGQAVDIAGNRFDNGTVTNGEGRLKVSTPVRLNVRDPLGFPVSGECYLAWTDHFGQTGGQSFHPGNSVIMDEYTIGNDGVRIDRFPYTLQVRKGTITNRTVLPHGQMELSVVLDILADLVPVHLSPDFDSIRAGQDIRFLARVENAGAGIAADSIVTFLVDGRVVDRQQIPGLSVRGTCSVYSDPWVATAGRHTLEARVDSTGNVRENNETNNNLPVQFNVSGSGSPGFAGPFGGWNTWFIPLMAVVMIIYVLLVLAVRHRRRRRMKAGIEPAAGASPGPVPAGGLEPVPAAVPGATRIKCSKCGRLNEAPSGPRPPKLKCELCGTRLKLMK